MRDEEKRPEIEKEKDLAMQLLGEDVGKFQECLKDLVGKVRTTPFVVAECARCARFEKERQNVFETIDDDDDDDEIYDARRMVNLFSRADFLLFLPFHPHSFSLFFSNETDQTSTRKRRIFRHAILRLDAAAVHGASRSDGAVRRHAQSRITVRPVVPFALSGLDSRENAFGAVSCGRRRKRGSGENRWEYRNRRTIILKPPSVCSSRPLYIFCGPFFGCNLLHKD